MVGCLCFLAHGPNSSSKRVVILLLSIGGERMSSGLIDSEPRPRSMNTTFALLFTILMMTASLTGCIGQEEDRESPDWLFIGDSDIEGWDTSQFVNSTNIGDGGSLCSDALSSLDEVLEQYTPIHVVIVCGENDLAEDRTVEETFDDFQAMINKIIGSGASVTYMGTKPEPRTTELHDQYRDYDGRIQDFAVNIANEFNAPLNVVDVYQGFEDIGNPSSLYQEDELHLSLEGYGYWDQWLVQVSNDSTCIIWQSQECRVSIE